MGLDMSVHIKYDDQHWEEDMYWRKANAIHNYFVQNIQNGVDDCGQYFIPSATIYDLRKRCKAIIDIPGLAPDLLPIAEGFFFGSYDYDLWYMDSIQRTYEWCESAIKKMDEDMNGGFAFYYSSSW